MKVKKSKKVKVESPKGPIGYYIDRFGKILENGDCFTYELTVYELKNKRIELYDSKINKSKEYKSFVNSEIITKNNRTFIKHIDLLTAPLDYLENNSFKLIS